MTPEEKYQFREQVVSDAIRCIEPERVPVVPLISTWPLFEYGYTFKQNMFDPKSCFEAFLRFHREFEPDMAFGNPCIFSGKAMDIMGPKFLRYPGEKGGLPDDAASYQFLETEFPIIKEDEWDEVLNNRVGWILGKYMPRNFKALEPLKDFDADYITMNYFTNLWQLGNSRAIEAFDKLRLAISEFGQYMMTILELGSKLEALGYPGMIGGSLMCPFDLVGDMALGMVDGMIAMLEHPEELLELTNKVADDLVKEAKKTAMQNRTVKKIWFYLHKGMDGFMNDKQYDDYYFKPLLRVINTLVECGLTPVLQCQGKYNTRLDFLSQLPEKKCICFFEKTDMDLAKKKLEGRVCIGGNLSAAMLLSGKREDVIAETKRQIDTYGPGGGYIFSTDATIDFAKRDNLEAMFDTALSYSGH